MPISVIDWTQDGVNILDQTRLPDEEVWVEVRTVEAMVEAIQSLRVRGAPLIGVAAAMGLAQTAGLRAAEGDLTREWVEAAAKELEHARPTAVDVKWTLTRMYDAAVSAYESKASGDAVAEALRDMAERIWQEEIDMCRAIGDAGAELVPSGATILTHCNTGALATGGLGTAAAVIFVAHERGLGVDVVATETRPLRQGARLTAWELAKAGVPTRVIVDSAAASLMAAGEIDLVITGADRIAANGDAANKIGTYALAVLAKAHGIPFYIAAPRSTFDHDLASGDEIPIEQRAATELPTAPGAEVYNPAFDVTPAELIEGIMTDRGVLRAPYGEAIRALGRGMSETR
jgi:methylthioribose-1-phosphate isomerase